MADEEFEIDVYGDAENGQGQEQGGHEYDHHDDLGNHGDHGDHDNHDNHDMDGGDHGASATNDLGLDGQSDERPASSAPQQGVKRKQELDDRPTDPGATNALLISEMQWWNTEDEIRGWINSASSEDELKDITFSEHKVNGKSKGQAYVEFVCPQAATAAKRYIENMLSSEGNSTQPRRASVVFHNASNNPFKTLPKDAPQRQNRDSQNRGVPSGNNYSGAPVNNFQGNATGGGYPGNYRGRGGYRGNMRGGFNQNYGNSNMNAYNNNNMGGFNNMGGSFPRGGMGGGFPRGGGGGPMRGRGGMNMMSPVPMMGGGNMGMGGMMPGMSMMGNMGGGIGGGMGGFNPMSGGQFNPNFFGGNQGGGGGNFGGNNQGGGGDWGNPHGAKRARGE